MTELTQEKRAEEQEIDLLELARKLWRKRIWFYKAVGIAVVLGLIVGFSIPRTYSVTVILAPESVRTSSSRLASAAAMLGLGNLSTGNEVDALNITLFPDILASNPFALELYNMPVTPEDAEQPLLLNEYMDKQRQPWWGYILGLPGRMIGGVMSLFSDEKEESGERTIDPFRLTKIEAGKLKGIKGAMTATVDKKTGITTVTVTFQDPVVAACVADSVVRKLQDYVTDYRTRKATEDCAYWEKLYKERQQEYYEAQQRYAAYMDENKSLYTQKSKMEAERLQNDMTLAYQVYNQMAQQLQLARGKVQEAKPVFAVVEPATVPLQPAGPGKKMILIAFVFLALVGTAGWVLFGEELWKQLKEKNSSCS
ncbi:Wzz/FepE/Etk N-terminal domain-containing protein [uncultured Bacteroides sp.]|uniref:Wzz/FepE/Etk N-terminal domain-containing protein n=1 Tax=uncultured Bacteroides sp. TaxID=162156 RepID=UPI0026134482|nr:Wzz/FepE/Etk N-terminal domain-containing protein [uncultured Bacteroides sp.]